MNDGTPVVAKPRGYVSATLFFVAFLVCVTLVNWPYRYGRITTLNRPQAMAVDQPTIERSEVGLIEAGWPIKFYIRREYASLPTVARLDWLKSLENALVWLGVLGSLSVTVGSRIDGSRDAMFNRAGLANSNWSTSSC